MKKHNYTLKQIDHLNNYWSEIMLTPTDCKSQLQFLPGQYVHIYFDNDNSSPYSIASSPLSRHIKFIIYNGKNNKNINFFLANHNKEIFISEASGSAYYRNTDNKEILVISKNLGISPIISILEYLSDQPKAKQPKITLFNVVSSTEDLILNNYFEIMSKKINLNYTSFITNGTYNLNELYDKLTTMGNCLYNNDFYVFGSQLFVLDIYKELLPFCRNNFYSDVNIDLSKAIT